MVSIVPAGGQHGAGVAAVAEAVRFCPEMARSADGYLVYVASPEEYTRRLAEAGYSVVAVDEGRVVGFLRAVGSEEPGWSAEYAELAGHMALTGYVLIDQIGVLPEYKGQGVAQAMFDALVARSGARRLGAMIMHGPVRNARSLGFFTGRNGFSLVCEVVEAPYVWGYYERRQVVVS